MISLKTFLKWGALSIGVLVLLVAVAWAISRLMYPTEAQRAAIAEMDALPEYEGENAFPLLWSLGRDVPDAELEQVLDEDIRRFSATPVWPDPGSDNQDEDGVSPEYPYFDSVRDDYPDLRPSTQDQRMFCGGQDENCLDKVRRDLDAYTALIERNRYLLDRIVRLQEYDYIRSPFPPRLNAPFPSYQNVSYLRTRHAVEFASGQERTAVASLCREMQAWRRLSARADVLIDRSIGMAYASEHNGELLAQMLAEWPIDEPLPEACESALAPPELADVSLCNALRGEFQRMAFFNRHLYEYDMGLLERWLAPLVIDREASVGLTAQDLQGACSDSSNARLLADRRSDESSPDSVWRLACLGNFYGCVSNAVSGPALTAYETATLDHGARLRLLGTLAWMRERAGSERSPAELLDARPDALKSPEREIAFGSNGKTLQVPLYHPEFRSNGSAQNRWSVPLPPALHQATAD